MNVLNICNLCRAKQLSSFGVLDLDYPFKTSAFFREVMVKNREKIADVLNGEHITDIYITETGTTELENLSHNIIDIFITET